MSNYRCCVPKCDRFRKSPDNPKISILHRFPNPVNNRERFETWVRNIGGELIGMDYDSIFCNLRICRFHFEEKYRARFDNLIKAAVPTLNIPGFIPTKSDTKFNKQSSSTSKGEEIVRNRKRKIDLEEDLQDYEANLKSHKHDTGDLDSFQDVLDPEFLDDSSEKVFEESQEQDDEVINMCRICLQSFSKLISIESYGLRTAYEQLTGVSVEHDDGLPRELCVECATLLDKYHKFRDKSIQGNQLLRQIYSRDGVSKELTAEEIEQALTRLISKLDYNPEIILVVIDPNDTHTDSNTEPTSQSQDQITEPNNLSKTSKNKVNMKTDLIMSVDEPVAEEWLTLSDNDDENNRSTKESSVEDTDEEVSFEADELNLSVKAYKDPLRSEDANVKDDVIVRNTQSERQTEDVDIQSECQSKDAEKQSGSQDMMKIIKDIKNNCKKKYYSPQKVDPRTFKSTLLKASLSEEFYEITPYKSKSKWYRRGDHYYKLVRTHGVFLPTMYFKCHVDKCRAKFKVKEEGLTEVQGEHNHDLTPWVPNRNLMFQSLKQRSKNESTSLFTIYEEEVLKYPDVASHVSFDSFHTTMRLMRKLRQSQLQPTSLIEFSKELTEHVKYKYIVLDTVQTNASKKSTAIILAMESYIECFNACETVIADVNITIDSGANQFKVLTIFCVVDGHIFHPFFCIMENWCQELYEEILRTIWKSCGDPKPSNVYVDFDEDLKKAFFNITKVDVEIYLFYFVEALIKEAKLLGGNVRRGSVGWKCIQLYASLALLPPELIIEGLAVVRRIIIERNLQLPSGFHSYFMLEWIDKVGPDSLSVCSNAHRYSMMVENFHRSGQVMESNFTLWKFTDFARERFAIAESRFSSQAVGNLIRRNRDRNYITPRILFRELRLLEKGKLTLDDFLWQISQKLNAGLD